MSRLAARSLPIHVRLFSKLSRRRRTLVKIVGALVLAPVLLVLVMAIFTPLPPELREPPAASMRVLARNGHLLREVRSDDGARSHVYHV